jgi:hypothetical protein
MKLGEKLKELELKNKLKKVSKMFFKNILKFLFSVFFLISLFNIGFSIKPIIDINETIDINYLNSYDKASVKVRGILEITNPSLIDTIYEISIPINLDSLIGFSKEEIYEMVEKNISIPNSNLTQIISENVLRDDGFSFDYNKIKAQLLGPTETFKVGYSFYGLVNYNIANETIDKNISFLEYYADDFNLLTNIVINLQKANREGNRAINNSYVYDSGSENFSKRLVSTDVQNPTGFDFILHELKVYRTDSSNPMYGGGDLLKSFNNMTFDPYEFQTLDAFDYNADAYSVYWVSSKFVTQNIIKNNLVSNIQFNEPSEGGGSNSGGSGGGIYFPDEVSNLLIKKTSDKTLIGSGEEFTVTISVINLGFGTLDDLTLLDEIPSNHIISDVSKGVKIEDESKLIFDIKQVEPYGEYTVSYTLVNKDTLKGVTYLKPASIEHEEKIYFSDGVLIISELLPDKKVYVQKQIEFVSDEFSKVTITVKNLGTNILRDLLVSELIDQNAILKEISQVFDKRGVWNIKSLGPGEEWEVTYLVERNSKIETLPNVFGVDSDDVFGTLVFSEEVITIFQEQPKTVEKIGMIVAVGLLVFYLLF